MGQSSVVRTPDNSEGEESRRSTRIERSVPLIIFGQNSSGEPFVERTVSTSLNLHGCRYPSRHDYGIGSWITLQVVGLEVEPKPPAVRARVRSVHSGQGTRELQQVGVELESPSNVWGISTPPQDWLRTPAGRTSTAQFAAAAVPAEEPPTESIEDLEPAVNSEPKLAEVATFPSPSPAAAKPQAPKPASEVPRPQRVVVTPDGLIAALQTRLQQEAEKAAQAAVVKQVDEVVQKALSSIHEVRESSVREIRELFPPQIEALRLSSKDESAGEIPAHWKERLDIYRGQVDEMAQRLEKQAAELRRELAKSQDFVDKMTREIEPQMHARLGEAVAHATSEFEGAAARATDRRYERLLEHAQTLTQEALLKLEVRSAEVQAMLQGTLNTAIATFERQTENLLNQALSETKDRAASALSSLDAESRAAYDARRQTLETDVARAAERATEQFRKGMKVFLYSCLVAAVSAVDEHSKATLDGLLKDNGKHIYDSGEDAAKQDEPAIPPVSDIDPITH
ncbi:MAG TPA: hypothetical protein VH110_05990 [Candidatus Acidoferrum sp.]|nr:hypothetical protein [Candidatus Acidoferrum sp.]